MQDSSPKAPAAAQVQAPQVSEYVRKVFEDRDGNLWLGTNSDGVARYDGTSLTYFGVQNGFGGKAVRGIAQDRAGVMWFATDGGVSRYEDGKFTSYRLGINPGDSDTWSMMLDRSGVLWVGTRNGVRRFDGTSFVPFPLPRVAVENSQSRFSPLVVFSMAEDQAGNLWFGTDGEGVHKYDGMSFTSYTTAQGLAGNQVRSVYADRRGRVWVGTEGGGVSCFEGGAVRTYTSKDGLNNDRVFGVLEDRAGNMWFSTLGAGACRYDGTTFTPFREERGLTRSHVQSMHETRDGTLWFGCSGGLFRLEGERFVNVTRNGPWRAQAQPPAAVQPVEAANPMAGFARMIGGRWKNTAQAGTVMFDTWQWGPGQRWIRAMTDGRAANGDPWRSVSVFYWHPGRKQIRTLGLQPVFRGINEGSITFDGQRAEGFADLYQTGGKREMGLRWTFDGDDTYHDALLEKGPNGYEVLNGWDRVRVPAAAEGERAASVPLLIAAKPSALLQPLEKLLGRVFAGKVEPNDQTKPPGDAFRMRTTFEYVPYADAIYGRVETSAGDGPPTHTMDLYLYHHTGARGLRCLALSSGIGIGHEGGTVVYEGDITPVDGGRALTIALKAHQTSGTRALDVRVDFEEDGTVRQRVWSVDGERRTPALDVRHTP